MPSLNVWEALSKLARQTEHQLLFSYESVHGVESFPLQGEYTVPQALDILLKDTGLSGKLTEGGVILITSTKPEQLNNGEESMISRKNEDQETLQSGGQEDQKNRQGKNKASSLLAVLVSALGINTLEVSHSWAQSDVRLEEVIVTAEKRSESLQDVSMSIQVLSGDELRASGKRRLDEIMNGAVGMQAQGAELGASFYMRGVGFDRGQSAAFSGGPSQSPVTILVDGVVQERETAIQGGTLDVSQVEVMRGPQSTTLGGGSLAGAVSLVSNPPEFGDTYTNLSFEAGNYGLLVVEGVTNIPLSDKTALRIAASINQRDAYVSSGAGDSDLENAQAKFRWQPNEDLDLVFKVARQVIGGKPSIYAGLAYSGHYVPYTDCIEAGVGGTEVCSSVEAGGLKAKGYPYAYGHVDTGEIYLDRDNPWDDGLPTGQWGHDAGQNTKLLSYSADLNWDLGWANLAVVPSYQEGSLYSVDYGGAFNFTSRLEDYENWQLDAHLNSSEDSFANWIVGVNYYNNFEDRRQKFTVHPGYRAYGTVNCTASVDAYCYAWDAVPESRQVTTSVYGNIEYSLTDNLRLIGGLRYTQDKKTAVVNDRIVMGDTNGPSTPLVFEPEFSATWHKVTYTAGVEYDVGEQMMTYMRYSTGYQPGNINFSMGAPTVPTPEQTLKSLTAGIKSRFFDNSLQVNLEAFRSEYNDRGFGSHIAATRTNSLGETSGNCVYFTPLRGSLQIYNNWTCITAQRNSFTIPDLTSQGIDLEIDWLVTDNDTIELALEYLDSTQSAPIVSGSPFTEANVVSSYIGTPPGTIADPITSGDAAALLQALADAQAVYDGAPTQSSPKWSGNFTYRHDFRLAGGTLSPSVNVTFKSAYWTAALGLADGRTPYDAGGAEQDDYQIYNAYLRWTADSGLYEITGYVKNIENTPVLTNWGAAGSFRGPEHISLDPPRTYGIIFNVHL